MLLDMRRRYSIEIALLNHQRSCEYQTLDSVPVENYNWIYNHMDSGNKNEIDIYV